MSDNEEQITWPSDLPFDNVMQFKLTLEEIEPSIWRRIVVPESYTLYDLHVAIQDSLGWFDYHLHCFEFEDATTKSGIVEYESPWTERWSEADDWVITTEVPLSKHFEKAGDRALYKYDYGDGWMVEVCLEQVSPKEEGRKYPLCLDGELAGPPEDCGGEGGYYRCVKAVKGKDDSEGLLEWLDGWRPDDFSPEMIVFDSPRERFKLALEE